jgi:hypothetical protein
VCMPCAHIVVADLRLGQACPWWARLDTTNLGMPIKSAILEVIAAQAISDPRAVEAPHQAVLARAKQAIAHGDRTGALALLHVLVADGPRNRGNPHHRARPGADCDRPNRPRR